MRAPVSHAGLSLSSRAEVFRARLVRVRGLLLQTFCREKDVALRSGILPEPGGRPGVHHVDDGAELAGELHVHGYGKRSQTINEKLWNTPFVPCSGLLQPPAIYGPA